MKRVISVFVFLVYAFVSNAQDVVGSYLNSYFGKTYSIEASLENNTLNKVYIEVETKGSKQGFISIDSKDLQSFKASLLSLRDKYLEWKQIAISNNVTKMNKDFDITFPTVTVAWYTSKWWFSFNRKITMSFMILENGDIIAVWSPKVSASSNEYIDETFYFVFGSKDDFTNLLKELDGQKICDKLLKTKNAESLFN